MKSVIIPVKDEEENIIELVNKLNKYITKEDEIIFIDDGSTDNTYTTLKNLNQNNLKIIKFKKNYGQSAALTAGFEEAVGDIVITLDGDLQNDPSDIPLLINELDKGYDTIVGWRYPRKDNFSKILFSKVSYYLHKWTTGLNIHDNGCSFKIFRKECIKDLNLYGEMHRFIPILIHNKGYKINETKVRHYPRTHGKTKYGIQRLFNGLLDLLFINFWIRYSFRPIHFFGLMGLILMGMGFLTGIYKSIDILIKFFVYNKTISFSPLLLFGSTLFIIGFLFVSFGFLAELITRSFYDYQHIKNYEIEEIK